LVDAGLLQGAEVLFSEGIPTAENMKDVYSFAWSGAIPHESTVKTIRKFLRYSNVKQLEADLEVEEIYASIPQNCLIAFENGDIAYLLAHNAPIRKNKKPYTGCRVLDGTKSDDDWVGYVKPKDITRVINPKKGYIVTANNRQMPDNVVSDVGATISSTIRAQRITEMIEAGI
jgi:penicillin amidase